MRFPKGPRHRIQVKQEAVTRAVAMDSSKCYIAESIKLAVPEATHVAVDLQTIRYTDAEKGLRYVYLTPYAAQLALLSFDEGITPDPFSFVLKNAHVSSAGTKRLASKDAAIMAKAKTRQERKNAKRKAQRRKQRDLNLSGSATLVRNSDESGIPRRVGGKRPPQLRMLRQFGVRAFRGASVSRKASQASE